MLVRGDTGRTIYEYKLKGYSTDGEHDEFRVEIGREKPTVIRDIGFHYAVKFSYDSLRSTKRKCFPSRRHGWRLVDVEGGWVWAQQTCIPPSLLVVGTNPTSALTLDLQTPISIHPVIAVVSLEGEGVETLPPPPLVPSG